MHQEYIDGLDFYNSFLFNLLRWEKKGLKPIQPMQHGKVSLDSKNPLGSWKLWFSYSLQVPKLYHSK